MVTGNLQIKGNKWYMVFRGINRSAKQVWRTTGIAVKATNKDGTYSPRKSAENKRKAEAILQEKIEEFGAGASIAPNPLFLDLLDEWFNRQVQEWQPNTRAWYERTIHAHVKPFFEPLRLRIAEINTLIIQQYVDCVAAKVAASSAISYIRPVSGVCKYAAAMGYIPYNPANNVYKPHVRRHEKIAYTKQQCEQLLNLVKGTTCETGVILGLFMCLRYSEFLGLRWSDVDFDNNAINIRHAKTPFTKDSEDTTKTPCSRRTLPMPQFVKNYLLRLKSEQEEHKRILGNCWHDTGYVYVKPDGSAYSYWAVNRSFERLMAKQNILPAISFHNLRHTGCTIMVNNRVAITVAQKYMGHASASTTLSVYTHADESMLTAGADVLDSVLGC